MSFLLTATFLAVIKTTHGSFVVPGLPKGAYYRPGDIVLGGLFRVHTYSSEGLCGDIHSQKQFQYHMAMVYAIENINRRSDVLPNITLGFAILDDCTKDQVALGRTMNFLEPARMSILNNTRNDDVIHYGVLPPSATYYGVTGVISGTNSQNTMTSAALLNLFQIPMVGTVSTSELLSNKAKYKYFQRVVPSDTFQAQVIIDIIAQFNWTYVIVINSEGSYGEMGGKAVRALAADQGICVAYSHEINKARGSLEFEDTAAAMVKDSNAKVVVLFTQGSDARKLIDAVTQAAPGRRYIWIASDGVSPENDLSDFHNETHGSFFIDLYSTGQPGFSDYFENLSPYHTDNPWITELWEETFDCMVADDLMTNHMNNDNISYCDPSLRMGNMSDYSPYKKTALFSDSVSTFAFAIDAAIRDLCSGAYEDKSILASCLNGPQLLGYLQNVTFNGSYGEVRFDDSGNADGKYVVKQMQLRDRGWGVKDVGIWDKATLMLAITEPLQWPEELIEEFDDVPESVCSHPCLPGQYKVQLELKCCWECRDCRSNEITNINQTSCEECLPLYWPTDDASTCEVIPPDFLRWSEPLSILVTLLAIAGLLNLLAVLVTYVRNRHERLIKATSLELSMMTLTGIFLAYLTVLPTISRPGPASCYCSRLGFHISFAIIYAPLLAKTSRIFRIFSSAKRGMQHPSCISSMSQVSLSFGLVAVQIVASICTTILSPPNDLYRMPVRTEKYVELLCDMPLTGMVPTLMWNLLLILCCSAYAFKARMLPDNFNESRYIFLSVSTTVFLWCAFLPTYFSAFYAKQKALLLSAILLLNSTVIVFCLYYPKVYAIYYVNDDDLNIQGTMSQKKPSSRSKVTPISAVPENQSEPDDLVVRQVHRNNDGHM